MVTTIQTEGFRLSEFRKTKGITQKEFADAVGCSQPNLNKIEKGLIGISAKIRARIFEKFPDLNPGWLSQGMGRMLFGFPETPELSGLDETEFNKDLAARFIQNLDKIEQLLQEGKISYDMMVTVFGNLRKILQIQEDRIRELEEDKEFLKTVVLSLRSSDPKKKGSK